MKVLFDITVLFSCFLYLLIAATSHVISKNKKHHIVFGALLLIITTISFLFSVEDWRTHVVLFFVFFFTVFNSFTHSLNTKFISAIKTILVTTGFLLAMASAFACYAFPVNNLSAPTGKFAVGTASFMMADTSRPELYGNNDWKGHARRIMVQVWYPALYKDGTIPTTNPVKSVLHKATGSRQAWIPDTAVHKALARFGNFPEFIMSHLGLIQSNSYQKAIVASPAVRYPVIIISHGWGGSRYIHANLAEEYASHGFIVFAIDHTYGSLAVEFPDGAIAYRDENALGSFMAERDSNYWKRAFILENTYAGDIELLLNAILNGSLSLELPTKAGIVSLQALLDSGNIGLIAHSTGAGAGYYLTEQRNEIKAYIALDAWLEPVEETLAPSQASVLHVGSAQWEQGPNAELVAKTLKLTPNSISLRIKDSTHMDMAMIRYMTSIGSLIRWSGTINKHVYESSLRRVTLDWFTAILIKNDPEQALTSARALKGIYPFY